MSDQPQVCVKGLRAPVLAAALRTGRPPETLLAELGLTGDVVADPTVRLPHDLVCAIWEKLARLCDEPCFGLFSAQVVAGAPLDFVDYALSNVPTVRAMVSSFARWQRLFHDASVARYVEQDDEVVFEHRLDGDLAVPRHLEEFILATWVLKLKKTTGRELPLREVAFTSRPGADRRLYQSIFGAAALRFESPDRRLVFDRALLDLPLVDADPSLGELFAQQVERALARTVEGDSEPFLDRARKALLELLPEGEADVERLADVLSLSPRTLHRRLAEHGVSFRELLDDVRERMARVELTRGTLTVTDVAFLLGYSDLTAFSRAFRRWTGKSPAEFRRAEVERAS